MRERIIAMKERITDILSEVKNKISAAVSEGELQNVKSAYIGRQGALSLLMKELPNLVPALRPEMGSLLNQAKKQATELVDAKRMERKLRILTVLFRESCRGREGSTPSRRCAMT